MLEFSLQLDRTCFLVSALNFFVCRCVSLSNAQHSGPVLVARRRCFRGGASGIRSGGVYCQNSVDVRVKAISAHLIDSGGFTE